MTAFEKHFRRPFSKFDRNNFTQQWSTRLAFRSLRETFFKIKKITHTHQSLLQVPHNDENRESCKRCSFLSSLLFHALVKVVRTHKRVSCSEILQSDRFDGQLLPINHRINKVSSTTCFDRSSYLTLLSTFLCGCSRGG